MSVAAAADQSSLSESERQEIVHCCQYGETDRLQTLLHRHGLTASTFYDADGCSLLHWAAVNGRVLILQQIIQSIPSDRSTVSTVVNTPGGALCEIPLQWACRYPHLSEVVRLLLQHGSDANFRNVHGQSSLHIAVSCQENISVPYLLASMGRANVDLLDDNGRTPLQALLVSPMRTRTLDMQRLLVSLGCDGSMCHESGTRSNIFHSIISGGMDVYRGQIDVESVCLLLVARRSEGLLFAKDATGESAYSLASRSRSYYKVKIFVDLYMYQRFRSSPTYSSAISAVFAVLLGHYLGPIAGPVAYLLVFIIGDLFTQSSLSKISLSRVTYGCVWGLIIDILLCYHLYVVEFTSLTVHLLVLSNAVMILASLLLTHQSPPHSLPRNSARIEELNLTSDSSIYRGSKLALCSSCLSSKQQASTHCSYCGLCVCVLDHHCIFVDNCIGRGNRRIFVIFTLSASVGTMFMSVLSYSVQLSHYCGYEQSNRMRYGYMYMVLKQQNAVMLRQPLLVIMTLVSFGASIWIFVLFFQQIIFIMNETTTFEIMRGHYSGRSFFYFFRNGRKSIRSLWLFFRYGTFTVSSCTDDNHNICRSCK